jgi:pimeloyl-ACP methyl ester carboxylesterase/class 3 adenylate cyclase
MRPPEVHYARSGDVSVAYTAFGSGPVDLVYAPGTVSHVEFDWEDPYMSRFFSQLGSFARVVKFDKRGTGLSDRVGATFSLEERTDDIRAVMDAAGLSAAHLVGVSEGGAMCAVFAATHPERVLSLSLYGANARMAWAPDYPHGRTREQLDALVAAVPDALNADELDLAEFAPSLQENAEARRYYMTWARRAGGPASVIALEKMNQEMDTTDVLGAIRVPTLVIHRRDDTAVPVAKAHYLADRIPGAKLVLLDGVDHFPWVADTQSICVEIEEFVTGKSHVFEPDRALMTVLFTDIVDSTKHAAAVGDRQWHDLLERYDGIVRREVDRFRGRLIKSTGDGVLATFDGPGRAIRSALALIDRSRALGFDIRAGLHAGEVEVLGDDIAGIAVHIGARVSALAGDGEVLVSNTVKDLVAGSGIGFRERGEYVLKGVPGKWRVWAVESGRAV